MKLSVAVKVLLVAVVLAPLPTALQADESKEQPSEILKSEAVSAAIQEQLGQIVGQALTQPSGFTDYLAGKITRNAKCAPVTAEAMVTVRSDEKAKIRHLNQQIAPLRAEAPFADAFLKLLSPLQAQSDTQASTAHFRVKVTRIELKGNTAEARALLFATNKTPAGSVQLNSTWLTHWTLSGKATDAKLDAIDVVAHQEATLRSSKPWFVDATAALFADEPIFENQVNVGTNRWLNRIERFAGSNIYARYGHALGDANGDGLDDVYLCQPGGLPNRLFLQQPDGRLRDGSAMAGVDFLNETRSALLVDLDNDGDQDLVVGTPLGVFLCQNNGKGIFQRAGELPEMGRDVKSLSAVDYDNDGDLDIHVCAYHSDAHVEGRRTEHSNVYDLRSKGGINRLYRNDLGQRKPSSGSQTALKFTDITSSVGLDEGNERYSFAAAWEDFDNDGDQDLYVANDFGINCLYENEDGKFRDVSAVMGVEDYGPGMSAAWGDYNRDGRPDLYVGNMFSAAGNRVTRQTEFEATAHGTSRESFQRFNKGNSLYTFNGDTFDEVPGAAGAENALWSWSSLLADIDNDSYQDALVANGYITGPGGGDL